MARGSRGAGDIATHLHNAYCLNGSLNYLQRTTNGDCSFCSDWEDLLQGFQIESRLLFDYMCDCLNALEFFQGFGDAAGEIRHVQVSTSRILI